MSIRAESVAATRRALLDAAADLLDLGGPEAVTLRAVGARAGVTRGAPYRHFPDKESLLIAVGTRAWDRLGDQIRTLRTDPAATPTQTLRDGILALIAIGRSQPHLYKLMFSNPPGDPTALARAAEPSQAEFLGILGELVDEQDVRQYGALLISTANGVAGMEASGQLRDEKWGGVSAEQLIDTLVGMIADQGNGIHPDPH